MMFFHGKIEPYIRCGFSYQNLIHEFSMYSRPSLKLRSRRPILSVSKWNTREGEVMLSCWIASCYYFQVLIMLSLYLFLTISVKTYLQRERLTTEPEFGLLIRIRINTTHRNTDVLFALYPAMSYCYSLLFINCYLCHSLYIFSEFHLNGIW